jgi:thermitase
VFHNYGIIGDKKMLLPEVAKGAIAPKMKFKGKKVEKGIWKKREVEFVSGEILIKPGKDRDTAFQEKLFSGDLKKAKHKRKFDRFGVGLIDAGDKIDVLKECERLEKNPEVEYAEPNMIDRIATTIPNDTGYPNQWALPMIDAPNAWDIETGNSNVLIAVLDTGIPMDGTPPSLCHPDLNDPTRIILGHDYINNDAYPRDDNGHGTHVAGIASAQTNNATGVAGLCWGSG